MIVIKQAAYEQIVEKFLHHLAGKLNVTHLMMDLEYSMKETQQSVEELEAVFLIYRSILLQGVDVPLNVQKLVPLFKSKNISLHINEKNDFSKERALILYLLYDFSKENNSITINKQNMIYEVESQEEIIDLESQIINKWRDYFNGKPHFLYNYHKTDHEVIFSMSHK